MDKRPTTTDSTGSECHLHVYNWGYFSSTTSSEGASARHATTTKILGVLMSLYTVSNPSSDGCT